ncbi:MAPEG family protein [Oceanobacter kriegii]|uniref:MAPEG family protein n=1 Tax=Oceanobacter kriegii TaxID=64972 RepID=UPI000413783A|nr:MAPEG family protein [Oceanobacter kriegii]
MAVFAAAILALVLVYLSLRVVKLRKRHLVAIGDGGHVDLQRAIRAQGNFTEYVPMALLLLYGLEQMQVADWLVGSLCLMLVVGRLVHAVRGHLFNPVQALGYRMVSNHEADLQA